MKNNNVIAILLYLLQSYGCSSVTQNSSYELYPSDTIKINLTEKAPFESRYIQYYNNGIQEVLLYYNDAANTIEKYDLVRLKFVGSIPLTIKIDGFVLHEDTMYLISKNSNQILMNNLSGEIIGKINYENSSEVFFLSSSFRNPIINYENHLIVSRIPILKNAEDIPKIHHEIKTLSSLTSNEYISFGEFPKEYHQGKWWHFVGYELSKALNDSMQIVVSYPVSHNLIIYDLKYETYFTRALKSKYLDNYSFPEFDNLKRKDSNYKIGYVASLGRYSQIMYDPYRQLYYRLVLHPQKNLKENGTLNSDSDRTWSIIISDANFNVLCEKKFQNGIYNFYNVFVSKNGLMVSNNHTSNPDFNPDKLSFTVFKLTND